MNDKIDRAPLLFQRLVSGPNLFVAGNVTWDQQGFPTEILDHLAHPALEALGVSDRQLCALLVEPLGDTGSDAVLVRDAEDDAACSFKESHGFTSSWWMMARGAMSALVMPGGRNQRMMVVQSPPTFIDHNDPFLSWRWLTRVATAE